MTPSEQSIGLSVIIPVIAACIAALAAVWGTWKTQREQAKQRSLARELKIAEFREEWLNNLRDAMASFQSYGVTSGVSPSSTREVFELGTKIQLFMNSGDEDYGRLKEAMTNLMIAASAGAANKSIADVEYIEVCHRILKREWDRLKRDLRAAEAGRAQ